MGNKSILAVSKYPQSAPYTPFSMPLLIKPSSFGCTYTSIGTLLCPPFFRRGAGVGKSLD